VYDIGYGKGVRLYWQEPMFVNVCVCACGLVGLPCVWENLSVGLWDSVEFGSARASQRGGYCGHYGGCQPQP